MWELGWIDDTPIPRVDLPELSTEELPIESYAWQAQGQKLWKWPAHANII